MGEAGKIVLHFGQGAGIFRGFMRLDGKTGGEFTFAPARRFYEMWLKPGEHTLAIYGAGCDQPLIDQSVEVRDRKRVKIEIPNLTCP
jgi:hypothetical protein